MPLTLRVPKFIYTIKGSIYNLRHFIQGNPIGGRYGFCMQTYTGIFSKDLSKYSNIYYVIIQISRKQVMHYLRKYKNISIIV